MCIVNKPPKLRKNENCYEVNATQILSVHVGDYENNQKSLCIAACKDYKYAGMIDIQCFCGDILPSSTAQQSGECTSLCPGNENERCGGLEWRMPGEDVWRISVFAVPSKVSVLIETI